MRGVKTNKSFIKVGIDLSCKSSRNLQAWPLVKIIAVSLFFVCVSACVAALTEFIMSLIKLHMK